MANGEPPPIGIPWETFQKYIRKIYNYYYESERLLNIFLEVFVMMNVSIIKTREMSKTKLTTEIRKRAKKLEKLGMSHEDACGFISGIMNLGIAMQEKMNAEK